MDVASPDILSHSGKKTKEKKNQYQAAAAAAAAQMGHKAERSMNGGRERTDGGGMCAVEVGRESIDTAN